MDNKEIKLYVFDTAGQEKYRSLSRNWYKQAKGVVMVFSIVDRNSFLNIDRWMNDLVNSISDF